MENKELPIINHIETTYDAKTNRFILFLESLGVDKGLAWSIPITKELYDKLKVL